jgi:hypothetical protein
MAPAALYILFIYISFVKGTHGIIILGYSQLNNILFDRLVKNIWCFSRKNTGNRRGYFTLQMMSSAIDTYIHYTSRLKKRSIGTGARHLFIT